MNPEKNMSASQEIAAEEVKNMETMNCRSGNSSVRPPAHPTRGETAHSSGRQMINPTGCQMADPIGHQMHCKTSHPGNRQMPGPAGCQAAQPSSFQTMRYSDSQPAGCRESSRSRQLPGCREGFGSRPLSGYREDSGSRTSLQSRQNSCCNALMNQVYQTGFAVDDILLYLDTHPCDPAALAYYQQVRALYQNAVQAYESQYGPLFMTNVDDRNYWTWINEPWPWEGGCI